MDNIEKKIQLADEKHDYFNSIDLREQYITDNIFHDDSYKAIMKFPEYISIYDEYGMSVGYDVICVLWTYKFILEISCDFYQVSHEQMMKYFDDFKRRCIQNGISLNAYYRNLSMYMKNIDIEASKEALEKSLKLGDSILSDCEACELAYRANLEIEYGDFNKGLKIAEPIFSGEKKCGEVPHKTYDTLLKHYIKIGDLDSAAKYENLLYRLVRNNKNFLPQIGTILTYYSLVDVDKGLNLFRKYLTWNLECKNPYNKFMFELGALKLFKNIKSNYNRKTIKLLLNENFPLYNKEGDYIIDDIINCFNVNVCDVADKFDKRNGNNNFTNMIK